MPMLHAGRGYLEYILSSCRKVLGEGCYHWHHDQVLRVIAKAKATALAWQLKKVPSRSASTAENSLRPNIVLVSEPPRQVFMLELTVPWEDSMKEASERKSGKQEELASECQSDRKTECGPNKVGCLG